MAEAVSRSIRNLRRRQNTHFRSPPNGAGSLFPSQCLLIEFGLSRLIVQPTLVFEFFLKEVNASLFPPPKPAFDEFFVTGMLSLSYMLMCATSYTSINLESWPRTLPYGLSNPTYQTSNLSRGRKRSAMPLPESIRYLVNSGGGESMPERQRDIVCRVSISDANSVHSGGRQGGSERRESGVPLYSASVYDAYRILWQNWTRVQ